MTNGMDRLSSSRFWQQQSVEVDQTVTKKAMDSVVSESLAGLSAQEREKALEELHGIMPPVNQENPEIIQSLLEDFAQHLYSIKNGTIYELAESIDRSYVTRRSFQMMFLRADRYDAKAAAQRMIDFLNLKLSLFGVSKLVCDITLADLTVEDKQALRAGTFQVLREPDNAGRTVIFGIPELMAEGVPYESELRARYYFIMSLMQSEKNQRQGISIVWYAVGANNEKNLSSLSGTLWCLPMYRSCLFGCYSGLKQYLLTRVAMLTVPTNLRPRLRIHYGNHQECQGFLMSVGIPRAALPLHLETDRPLLESHLSWLSERERIELEEANKKLSSFTARMTSPHNELSARPYNEVIDAISTMDVIFGRGRPTQEHTGNVHFRFILDERRAVYDKSNLTGRKNIAEDIVKTIKANGGRFLKSSESGWVEVPDEEARIKVTNAFRSQRKLTKSKRKT